MAITAIANLPSQCGMSSRVRIVRDIVCMKQANKPLPADVPQVHMRKLVAMNCDVVAGGLVTGAGHWITAVRGVVPPSTETGASHHLRV